MPLSSSAAVPVTSSWLLDGIPASQAGNPTPVELTEGCLLDRLATALHGREVRYCQWKGHWSGHRWASGRGDVDLLVDRESMVQFRSVMDKLGFKPALPSGARQIPGVESYFGHDPTVRRLLHLHVHFRLVLGDYWRTLYRLPIEREMLEAAIPGIPFKVPASAHQYLVFVLRMVLRQRGRPLLPPGDLWLRGVQGQLDYLDGRCNREEMASLLERQLPSVDLHLFERCRESLRLEADPIERAAVRRALHRRLRSHARHPSIPALLLATGEKMLPGPARTALTQGGMRLKSGGTVAALVGGDGAGKSTCARALGAWLSAQFPTMHAHLGRPPRSLLTLGVGGALKIERALYRWLKRPEPLGSTIELLRYVCTARDRHRLYQKAWRFAASGGIAVCERYPIPQNRTLVGPSIPELVGEAPAGIARLLRDLEVSYYETMLPPDALFVLRLHPELAVLRKQDEPADYVRARGQVVWDTDWSDSKAQVVDASRPFPEVLSELKSRLWSAL
jgi:thymidylate kinase